MKGSTWFYLDAESDIKALPSAESHKPRDRVDRVKDSCNSRQIRTQRAGEELARCLRVQLDRLHRSTDLAVSDVARQQLTFQRKYQYILDRRNALRAEAIRRRKLDERRKRRLQRKQQRIQDQLKSFSSPTVTAAEVNSEEKEPGVTLYLTQPGRSGTNERQTVRMAMQQATSELRPLTTSELEETRYPANALSVMVENIVTRMADVVVHSIHPPTAPERQVSSPLVRPASSPRPLSSLSAHRAASFRAVQTPPPVLRQRSSLRKSACSSRPTSANCKAVQTSPVVLRMTRA